MTEPIKALRCRTCGAYGIEGLWTEPPCRRIGHGRTEVIKLIATDSAELRTLYEAAMAPWTPPMVKTVTGPEELERIGRALGLIEESA